MIVVLWRAGLRISEALALAETRSRSDRGADRGARTGRAANDARSGWTAGHGSSSILDRDPRRPARRRVVLHPARPDPRPAMRARRDPCTAARTAEAAASVAGSRRTSSATHTQSRCPAKGSAGRHSTPTRSCRPRDHLLLPARYRQHRDHPRRPRTADTDDSSHLRPQAAAVIRRPNLPARSRRAGKRGRARHACERAGPSSPKLKPASTPV